MAFNLDAKAVAAALGKASRAGEGFRCCCPAHDDHNPSLAIYDRPGGGIIAKCLAGCSQENLRAALESRGLWPESGKRRSVSQAEAKKQSRRRREDIRIIAPVPDGAFAPEWNKLFGNHPTHIYEYRDDSSRLLMLVGRYEKLMGDKTFRPLVFVQDGSGARYWHSTTLPLPRPLYGLSLLVERPDSAVLIVEGEKTADAARKLFPDYVVVTWSGGVNSVDKADYSPLKGRKVTLWPDNDVPGRKAMEGLAVLLKALEVQASIVRLPTSLPDKWDVADPAPDGIDVRELLSKATARDLGLRRHIMSAKDFLAVPTPPQEFLIREWLPKGGLAMIWATRGLGKTWFALTLAIAVAAGETFLEYEVENAEVVLFVDGEMALGELQDRIRRLSDQPPADLHILPSEHLFAAGTPLNINDPADQQKIIDAIGDLAKEGIRPSLIILDNLSSLTAGIDENDNSALDGIIRWMLRLRHAGVTVLFVHHANKTGDQRGASRREDQLNTSIKLVAPEPASSPGAAHDGAHFIMEFTKVRGRKPKPQSIELKLVEMPDGKMKWSMASGGRISPRHQLLQLIAIHNPKAQSELVALTKRVKGTISKDCHGLEREGLITLDPPRLTDKGRAQALELWPDLYSILGKQDDLSI